MDDFSKHPESLSERRARVEDNASFMSVRDALISALRDLDAGQYGDVDCIVVCLREKLGEGVTETRFLNAGPDIQASIGLIETVKMKMYMDAG